MTYRVFGWIAAGLLAFQVGCQQEQRTFKAPPAQAGAAPARQLALESADIIGGPRWDRLQVVSGRMILTLFDVRQQRYVLPGRIELHLQTHTIRADGVTPRGPWHITLVDRQGWKVLGDGLSEIEYQRVGMALATVLHRFRGPWNLLSGIERPGEVSETSVGGESVLRVDVTQTPYTTEAYYFDPDLKRLRFVSADADTPGKDGTVTMYDWASFGDGLMLPTHMQARAIGDHVLLGDARVWDFELSDVQVR